jgi:hypothetical protein
VCVCVFSLLCCAAIYLDVVLVDIIVVFPCNITRVDQPAQLEQVPYHQVCPSIQSDVGAVGGERACFIPFKFYLFFSLFFFRESGYVWKRGCYVDGRGVLNAGSELSDALCIAFHSRWQDSQMNTNEYALLLCLHPSRSAFLDWNSGPGVEGQF